MTSYLISMYNEGVFCVLREPTGRELGRVALSRREQCLLPQTLFIFLILLLVLYIPHIMSHNVICDSNYILPLRGSAVKAGQSRKHANEW